MSGVLRLTTIVGIAFACSGEAAAQPTAVELRSDLLIAGLPLPECAQGVYGIRLTAQVDKKGEGTGALELDPNAPTYDEFGFWTTAGKLPPVKLDCTLKFVKKQTLRLPDSPRIAAPLVDVDWVLFAVQGPKVTSRLFLATEESTVGKWGRLLVHSQDGKVRYVVGMTTPPPPQPCHPGCFPAGTPIQAPSGTRPVENLRVGDVVTTVGPDGAPGQGTVSAVFVTTNRLIEVRTDGATLVTTETQPLALADGPLRAAGELKAGDRIYTWDGRTRRAVAVRSVVATGREAQVFNLVLGEPVLFVADGFLARSKPPAPVIDPPSR
jgi:Hint domain